MPKCKSIDHMWHNPLRGKYKNDVLTVLNSGRLDICPECGQNTLIHESGCEHCTNCLYSKCG